MKRRRVIVALVILLIMSHLWHTFFAGRSREAYWTFLVDVVILLLIFVREYVWDAAHWVLGRHRASVDRVVLDCLTSYHYPGHPTPEMMATKTGIKAKMVRASLRRLFENGKVEYDENDGWRKVFR